MTTIGLVVSRFYEDIADEMEEEAFRQAADCGVDVETTVYVPGVYDIVLAADRLARQDGIDAVTVLGAVISGDTDHDQVITHAVAQRLTDVSLDRDKPIGFGVIGPGMSGDEAAARIEHAADAVTVAAKLVENIPDG